MRGDVKLQRLAELRKMRKLTQDQLSKKLHVDQTTISAYENGRGQPDIDKLRQLCKILHVSADYLIGLSDFINPEVDSPNYIPVYRSLIDGFGQGKPLCYESIPMSLITKERSFLGMQISDDHMLPLYLPGDIILIDKSAPFNSGMYVLFTIESDGEKKNVLRRYYSTPAGIILQAANPGIEPLCFGHADCKKHRISPVGPVFQIIRCTELPY